MLPFVLLVFVFVLLILFCTSKDFTLPAEPFFACSILAFSRRLSHSKEMTEALFATRELAFCIGEKERGALQYYCLLPPLWWKRCVFFFCFCFFFCFLFRFCIMFFFLSLVAFLPITLQFLFHSAYSVTTYQPSNSLRKSGKQVTALARVQALEKQLKRKWTTSSQRKQPTFRDANIYSSRKDVWETREEIPYWWQVTCDWLKRIFHAVPTINQKHHPDLG